MRTKNRIDSIISTWWGIKWCQNIEKYMSVCNSSFARGIEYLYNNKIIEYKIKNRAIKSRITGSNKNIIYDVKIEFKKKIKYKPLSIDKGKNSIEEIKEFDKLLPSENEIITFCNCLDFVENHNMFCKHVVCSLLKFGMLLDDDPNIIYKIYGFNNEKFKSKNIIIGTKEELSKIFNIKLLDK